MSEIIDGNTFTQFLKIDELVGLTIDRYDLRTAVAQQLANALATDRPADEIAELRRDQSLAEADAAVISRRLKLLASILDQQFNLVRPDSAATEAPIPVE